VELIRPTAEHVPELGRICYEAFKDVSERHGFESDFASVDFGRIVIGMCVQSEATYGVAVTNDGRPAGSNFLFAPDDVGGVGPITVDLPHQGEGLGRVLMRDVLDHARQAGLEMVRLQQDSFNMRSLSLYASLGFDTKAPCAVMEPAPEAAADGSVRPVTEDDLPAIEELSRSLYKVNRRNEVATFVRGGPVTPLLREREGRVTGYFILGMMGHGVAETEDDALVLVRDAAARGPAVFARVFCPLIEGGLYRRFLAAGFRATKVMNLMALGPYEEPEGVWMPSVCF
jgi:GNAT superfamily N-acetyltransferase